MAAEPASGTEFPRPLSPKVFQVMRSMLHEATGIALSDQKLIMVQSRLGKRLRELGLGSFEAYLDLLQEPGSPEWVNFTNALTTNLTSFFREQHHFDRMPTLLPAVCHAERRIQVWSAGCSTGEEPYSIALTLVRAFPAYEVQITATDLDTAVLASASRGVYPETRIEGLDLAWKRLGFLRGTGGHAGEVRVRPEIRNLVDFRSMNLLTGAWPKPAAFHVVFCRNVMIYFEKPMQRQLVAKFRESLVPGGLLCVGHSESLLDAAHGLTSLGQTMYRRPEGTP